MKTHDIVCEAGGWAYYADGVYVASYPTWQMAINAAHPAAERDVRNGIVASLRYQCLDGAMLPLEPRKREQTVDPSQIGLKPQTGGSSGLRAA